MILTSAKRQEIIDEAMSWLRTPHRHASRVKGVGVDCAQFMIKVYVNLDLISEFDVGYYPSDWHFHRSDELYLQWVSKFCTRVEVPQKGDIALFKFGRCVSHGGIMIDDTNIIHSYIGQGVVLSDINGAELQGRLNSFWSLK